MRSVCLVLCSPVRSMEGDCRHSAPACRPAEQSAHWAAESCLAIVPAAACGISVGGVVNDDRKRDHRILKFAEPGDAAEDGDRATGDKLGELRIRQLPGSCLGSSVWTASVHLVRFLWRETAARWGGERLLGRAVLELGSGTGSTAIALAKFFGASRVVASDAVPELVDLIARNAHDNGIEASCHTRQRRRREPDVSSPLAVHEYEWGENLDPLYDCSGGSTFDLVIGAEITAIEGGHQGLVSCLRAVLQDRPSSAVPPAVFLAETRRNARQERFWAMVRRSGLEREQVAEYPQCDPWNLSFGSDEPVRIYRVFPVGGHSDGG